jgi:hypothetical protein
VKNEKYLFLRGTIYSLGVCTGNLCVKKMIIIPGIKSKKSRIIEITIPVLDDASAGWF